MPTIISVCAKKGSPGKSTTAFELAAGLLLLKKRVLTIDLDSQCNFTHSHPLTLSIGKVVKFSESHCLHSTLLRTYRHTKSPFGYACHSQSGIRHQFVHERKKVVLLFIILFL